MEDMPNTTLTQRRNEVSSGVKKTKKSTHEDGTGGSVDAKSLVRVLVWIILIVFVGVGAAVLLTNLLTATPAKSTDTKQPESTAIKKQPESTPVSLPVKESTDQPEPDTNTNTSTDDNGVSDMDQYSKLTREIKPQTTGNNLILNNFRFAGTKETFTYEFYNLATVTGEIDPAIRAEYVDNNLVVTLSNLSKDKVTGPNNSTSRTIAGVRYITGTETKNTGSVSEYKFLLSSQVPYKISVDKDAKKITIVLNLQA